MRFFAVTIPPKLNAPDVLAYILKPYALVGVNVVVYADIKEPLTELLLLFMDALAPLPGMLTLPNTEIAPPCTELATMGTALLNVRLAAP